MKKASRAGALCVCFFASFVSNSQAELIDRGNGLFYDTAQDITWIHEANLAAGSVYDTGASSNDGRMTWQNAMDWAANLEYGGYSDWRLPKTDPDDTTCNSSPGIGQGCTGSEMGHLYNVDGINADTPGLIFNLAPFFYWSETEFPSDSSIAFDFPFHTEANPSPGVSSSNAGFQSGDLKDVEAHAWAVRDGDVVALSQVTITGYDVTNADISGTGGWAHEYSGTITPTSGSLANYSGGTGTMADGVFQNTTVQNTQSFWTDPSQVSITLYFDNAYTLSNMFIYGGPSQNNVLPGLLNGFDITLNQTTQALTTTGFGDIGATGRRVNDQVDLVSAGLSGIAVSSVTLSNFSEDLGQNAFSIAEIVLQGNAIASGPSLQLSEANIAFGAVSLGLSVSKTITIESTGDEELALGILEVTASSVDFSISNDSCSGAFLSPGEICAFDINFAPISEGDTSTIVSIPSNAADSPHTINAGGEGAVFLPVMTISPDRLSFPDQVIETTSSPRTVTVTNGGTADLEIGAITKSGTGEGSFTVDALDCSGLTLPPGGECTIGVVFGPTAAGNHQANIQIMSNDSGSPHAITLQGNGISVDPDECRDPTADIGYELARPDIANYVTRALGVLDATTEILDLVLGGDFEGTPVWNILIFASKIEELRKLPKTDATKMRHDKLMLELGGFAAQWTFTEALTEISLHGVANWATVASLPVSLALNSFAGHVKNTAFNNQMKLFLLARNAGCSLDAIKSADFENCSAALVSYESRGWILEVDTGTERKKCRSCIPAAPDSPSLFFDYAELFVGTSPTELVNGYNSDVTRLRTVIEERVAICGAP